MFNFQQLDISLVVLFILLGCGIISQNSTIIISTGLLIVLKMLPISDTVLPYLESHGLNLGIIILTIGVLAPIATGKISGETMLKSFVSWQSLIAIVVGVFVAWLGGRGVKLMSDDPSVVSGLLVGTVIGVAFLRGVPVGPLIAAGMVSLFYSLK